MQSADWHLSLGHVQLGSSTVSSWLVTCSLPPLLCGHGGCHKSPALPESVGRQHWKESYL